VVDSACSGAAVAVRVNQRQLHRSEVGGQLGPRVDDAREVGGKGDGGTCFIMLHFIAHNLTLGVLSIRTGADAALPAIAVLNSGAAGGIRTPTDFSTGS
jgi:hypothetical protein